MAKSKVRKNQKAQKNTGNRSGGGYNRGSNDSSVLAGAFVAALRSRVLTEVPSCGGAYLSGDSGGAFLDTLWLHGAREFELGEIPDPQILLRMIPPISEMAISDSSPMEHRASELSVTEFLEEHPEVRRSFKWFVQNVDGYIFFQRERGQVMKDLEEYPDEDKMVLPGC